ncbi:MAG: tRNA (adenosine(37)-N6)-dimethylallyltransferase MiaA [Bacteroidales bacterium]|nr:tRNA (adenosine(37)-N6)-dimethylallyltransferase MiaA [Bacteroidales bacterium]MCF8404746.1 tRNA (adenosine(37)-N6)-dimethylallyltransferase MiaA [Bacteroidales bacterium]
MLSSPNLIVVTGPTATGKTAFAAHLAYRLNGEIISADSRQVYRGMDLATGKDISDYIVEGQNIPFHLVDIMDPGYEYNVFEFQQDFLNTYQKIKSGNKIPVLCGGTGMYVESVLKGYKLIQVPQSKSLRSELSEKSTDALIRILESFKVPHNKTDTSDRKRLVKAIEIQTYYRDHPEIDMDFPKITSVTFGIYFERQVIRQRITERLRARLDAGMAEEVRALLGKGLTPDQLKFYGLEYRYLTQYIIGEIKYEEMFRLLNTAIHQFAKRQMTWFRRMEKQGIKIHWIKGDLPMEEKIAVALAQIKQ